MRSGGRIVGCALLAGACACAGCGASGAGPGQDARSARAYLAAELVLETAEQGMQARQEEAARRLIARVRADCPEVLAHAPAGGGPLRGEAFDAVEIARRAPVVAALRRFASAIADLRFGSPALTSELRLQSRAVSMRAAISQPDICADARAFVHSGGRLEPVGTARLMTEREAVEGADERAGGHAQQALLATIDRYESEAERRRRAAETHAAFNGPPAHAFVRESEELLRALGMPST